MWFHTCSGGKSCSELTHAFLGHNRFVWTDIFGLQVKSIHPKWSHLKQYLGICGRSIDQKKLKQCDFTHAKVATLVLKLTSCFYSRSLWGKRVVQIIQWF